MHALRSLMGIVPMLVLAALGSGRAGGVAGGVKMSSAKMCGAHGGTFNAANKTCSYTQSTRSAQQICQSQDGYYDTAADICTFNP